MQPARSAPRQSAVAICGSVPEPGRNPRAARRGKAGQEYRDLAFFADATRAQRAEAKATEALGAKVNWDATRAQRAEAKATEALGAKVNWDATRAQRAEAKVYADEGITGRKGRNPRAARRNSVIEKYPPALMRGGYFFRVLKSPA